jgi:hypothetical protein
LCSILKPMSRLQLELAPPPTSVEIAKFVPAQPDTLNRGVFDQQGRPLPPQFDYHVDDNLYANEGEHLVRVVSASILALYSVLGFFPRPELLNPLSTDNLDTRYSHQRKALGNMVDTRRMEVAVLASSLAQRIELLGEWIQRTDFSLREISSPHGS